MPAILDVAARVTGMGFTAVARVTEDRWIACAVHDEIAFGLQPGGELPVATTICNEIRDCGRLVAIDHVAEDPVYRDHHTPARYGFQSYLSVPIWRRDGVVLRHALRHRSAAAPGQRPGDGRDVHAVRQPDRAAPRRAGEARAGRNRAVGRSWRGRSCRSSSSPCSGTTCATRSTRSAPGRGSCSRRAEDAGRPRSAEIIERGARRMAGLIDDVLDFARGRLGGGLDVQPESPPTMPETIAHVVTEVQTAWPGRAIERHSARRARVLRPAAHGAALPTCSPTR